MKKRYIKPALLSVITLTENNLLEAASRSSIDGNGQWISKDESEEGSEAEGAASKGFTAWDSWEE